MDNYTVTFVYDGDFDLPVDENVRGRQVPKLVLEKLGCDMFNIKEIASIYHLN